MAARKNSTTAAPVSDYRYDSKRKNNPPAGLAAQGRVQETPKHTYSYDPHLPPVLRSDNTGESDRAGELLATVRQRALTAEEAKELSELLRNREPWLEWAGKRETKDFVVDPVALHIHERVSTQAILKAVEREDTQKDLFADPQLPFGQAVQFYRHDVDWANRLILGDSLQVMASLSRREDLAGKVQMIYMDPPYGVKFASNFQPEISRRDVKDKEQYLTREPEMVKAYRDTWTLGVHSYLAYLRDRLVLARELLTETGSIFVQISDENLHRVRAVMDEVFGAGNFCSVISFRKTAGANSPFAKLNVIGSVSDYLLWYARDGEKVKYHQLFQEKSYGDEGTSAYTLVEQRDGHRRRLTATERDGSISDAESSRVFRVDNLTSTGWSESLSQPAVFRGEEFRLSRNLHWKTTREGMSRLDKAARIEPVGRSLAYVRYIEDFPVIPRQYLWIETATGGFGNDKFYVVQTVSKVIERCMLMTTDPGDLVLDPTCGSGTTAYVAEQWGRRWITTDTSRVAVALARQRLMTSTFPHYAVKGDDGAGGESNPARGFTYKTVPHITLKSIAQNVALDQIFARHQAVLDARLADLNAALQSVTPDLRKKLKAKLAAKQKVEGKRSITDADRRRWELPETEWKEWEVPFDTDLNWPVTLQ